jgi:hypothetical protein
MTDWNLIRDVMNAALDACEHAERLKLGASDRDLRTRSAPVVSVFDILTSAWTYPEKLGYEIIRARHALSTDVPYRLELARVVAGVGAACAELVGSDALDHPVDLGDNAAQSLRSRTAAMATWYRHRFTQALTEAAANRE